MFETLFQPSSALAAVSALADLTIKAALILSLAGIATALTTKRPASVRHAIWLAAVVGVLAMPLLTASLPSWRVLPANATLAAAVPATGAEMAATAVVPPVTSPTDPAAEAATPAAGTTLAAEAATPDAATTPATATAPVTAASGSAAANPADQGATAAAETSTPSATSGNLFLTSAADLWSTIKALHWSVLLTGIWLLGVLVILGNYVVGAIGLYLVARRARPVDSQDWHDLAEEIGDRLWITRDVTLLKSHVTTMPVTWGGRKPVVLLPSDADTWSDERRRYVLTHEFAHIRRWDCTTQGFAQLACALYWFNPLVWIASRRLRIERERACDDQVLMAGGKASSYAEHLLDIARSLRATLVSPLGAVAMARPSQLEGRVLAILDPERHRKSFSKSQTKMVMGIAGALVLPIAAMAPVAVPDHSNQGWAETEHVAAAEPTSNAVVNPAAPEEAPGAVDWTAGEDAAWTERTTDADVENLNDPRATVSLGMLPSVAGRKPVVAVPDTIDSRKRKVADAFILALEDEDEQIRRQAAHMLGEIEDARAIPALTRTLKDDPSREVRRAALWALVEMDSREVMPTLYELAADETDDEARRQIAWMIGENADEGDRQAGQVLMRLLGDGDAEVRATAVWGLAEMEYTPALNAVLELTEDENDEVRSRAVWAVAELAEEASSDEALQALTRALKSGNAEVRSTAAWALGELEDGRAVEALIDAVGDSDADVREKAIWALGEIEDPRAIQSLARALSSGDAETRQRAAWALGEIDTEASHRAIATAINDSSPKVRKMALHSLAELEDPASIGVLAQAATDEDASLRKTAVHALSELEDQRAAPALVAALRDSDPSIRRYAAYGLSELEPTREILSGVRGLLSDGNAEVRRAAIHTLGEFEDAASAEALLDALDDGNAENRRAAIWALAEILEDQPSDKAVDALSGMLRNDGSAENRKAAAYALGELGSMKAIDVLRDALQDENRDVRRAAANALSDIDWDSDDEEEWEEEGDESWNDDTEYSSRSGQSGLRIELDNGHLASLGASVGMAIGDVTEIAMDAAGAALASMDFGDVMESVRYGIAELDVDAMVDDFEAEVAHLDAELEMQIRMGLIDVLADVMVAEPGSRESRAAVRALRRMNHSEARRALKRGGHCDC